MLSSSLSVNRRYPLLLGSILLLAFLIRLTVGFQLYSADPMVTMPESGTDMATYLSLSDRFSAGTFQGAFYFQPLYYTLILPGFKLLFETVFIQLIVFHAVLGTAAIGLTAEVSRKCWGEAGAIISAILMTFCYSLILFTPYVLTETFVIFGASAVLWMIMNLNTNRPFLKSIGLGLLLGFCILARGNFVFFVPICLWQLWVIDEKRKKTGIILLFLIAFLIPQLPYIIHNTAITHQLSGATINGSNSLVMGNNPEATWGGTQSRATLPAAWMDSKQTPSPLMRMGEWGLNQPGGWFELQIRKTLGILTVEDLPNNISRENGSHSLLLKKVGLPIGWILFLSLGSLFLWRVLPFRERKEKKTLLIFLSLSFLGVVLFPIYERYKLFMIPGLTVLAPGILLRMTGALRERQWKRIILCFAAGGGALVLTVWGTDLYRKAESVILDIVAHDGIRIPLSDSHYLYKDNGPFVCGGWRPCEQFEIGVVPQKAGRPPLKRGDSLAKRLSGTEGFQRAELTFVLFSVENGTVLMEINGLLHSFQLVPGMNVCTAALPRPDSHVCLEMRQCPVSFWGVEDVQRNFGRSMLNGKTIPAEWVMELHLFKEEL